MSVKAFPSFPIVYGSLATQARDVGLLLFRMCTEREMNGRPRLLQGTLYLSRAPNTATVDYREMLTYKHFPNNTVQSYENVQVDKKFNSNTI